MPYCPRIVLCRAGEGRGEGTEGGGGCGEETWSGSRRPVLRGVRGAGRGAQPVSGARSRKLAPANSPRVSALILGRTRFSVTAPALLVVPLFMCRWCGHKAGTGTAPRAFGSVTFQWGGVRPGTAVSMRKARALRLGQVGVWGPRGDRWDAGSALSRENPAQ